MLDMDQEIYVVWGPTAEWGDGSGPLGYFPSSAEAEDFIDSECEFINDAELQGLWPYDSVGFATVMQPLSAILDDEPPIDWTDEELFEFLNEQ